MPQLLTALVTPFQTDQSIDFKALDRLILKQIEAEVSGLVLLGTTAEAELLSENEKLQLLDFVFERVPPHFEITIGCSKSSSKETLAFAKTCQKWPLKQMMILTPPYLRPSAAGLIAHYKQLSDEGIAFMVYLHPGRTGCNPSIDTLQTILSLPGCTGLKDASGGVEVMTKLGSYFNIYSGDDSLILPHLSLGTFGLISVASNLIPQELKEIIDAFPSDPKKALNLFHKQRVLIETLFSHPNPIGIKAALHLCEGIENILRLPYIGADEVALESFKNQLLLAEYNGCRT